MSSGRSNVSGAWRWSPSHSEHLGSECTDDMPVHHPLTRFSTEEPVPAPRHHTFKGRRSPPRASPRAFTVHGCRSLIQRTQTAGAAFTSARGRCSLGFLWRIFRPRWHDAHVTFISSFASMPERALVPDWVSGTANTFPKSSAESSALHPPC